MHLKSDILIIGGGLAGLTAALHLRKAGLAVILIEKNSYPNHKVCGEYISNEVLPYLNWLGVDVESLNPTHINKLHLTTQSEKSTYATLPLGGFGISRYTLDNYLFQLLLNKGIKVFQESVTDVQFDEDLFTVRTTNNITFNAKQVIGAYGKRSALDIKLDRAFIKKKAPFLAIKAHYKGEFPNDIVALHNFTGGYCGVSKVEDDKINICYLADYETFKEHKNIESYQQNVLMKNKVLKDILQRSELLFETPITISQLSFGAREAVTNHVLMVGDAAGLIHPLCGNGMAMAIHGAKIVSEILTAYLNGDITSRAELEKKYTKIWNKTFNSRLKTGSILSSLLQREILTDFLINSITKMPWLLKQIIKRTHGKPLLGND
ncbi:NAD(P)/FAD-dependent oxidoreductase [Pedobacter frigiditerrae]|uniref:NAD(P)/FAD-dependent oxidoreductase n=1 Tax=Pedobacter frigiditerrae TaxID=2530452 RepID=UPI00292F7D56|nr:NAD(P)/FAD-dependent oxidoreductase [Pedobacter frigiditerrae]